MQHYELWYVCVRIEPDYAKRDARALTSTNNKRQMWLSLTTLHADKPQECGETRFFMSRMWQANLNAISVRLHYYDNCFRGNQIQ